MTGAAGLPPFERIYVLNLPERADRRREIEAQLRRFGLSLHAEPVRLFRAVRPDVAGPFPSVGAHGCFMSHLGMLQEAVRDGLGSVLILEDDLDFVAEAEARLPTLLQSLEMHDWSLFYGGYELPDGPVLRSEEPPASGLRKVHPTTSVRLCHFIALRGAAIVEAARYLEALAGRPPGDPAGGPMHVDGAYTWLRATHPDLGTWIAVPQMGYQRSSRTDIHPLRWYDRWPLVRDLAQATRRLLRAHRKGRWGRHQA